MIKTRNNLSRDMLVEQGPGYIKRFNQLCTTFKLYVHIYIKMIVNAYFQIAFQFLGGQKCCTNNNVGIKPWTPRITSIMIH